MFSWQLYRLFTRFSSKKIRCTSENANFSKSASKPSVLLSPLAHFPQSPHDHLATRFLYSTYARQTPASRYSEKAPNLPNGDTTSSLTRKGRWTRRNSSAGSLTLLNEWWAIDSNLFPHDFSSLFFFLCVFYSHFVICSMFSNTSWSNLNAEVHHFFFRFFACNWTSIVLHQAFRRPACRCTPRLNWLTTPVCRNIFRHSFDIAS